MVRTIPARDALANIAAVLDAVHESKEPIIVERDGSPYAVVISPEDYERMDTSKSDLWSLIDSIRERNADKDPDEVLADVTAQVEAVRQERYERRTRAATRRH